MLSWSKDSKIACFCSDLDNVFLTPRCHVGSNSLQKLLERLLVTPEAARNSHQIHCWTAFAPGTPTPRHIAYFSSPTALPEGYPISSAGRTGASALALEGHSPPAGRGDGQQILAVRSESRTLRLIAPPSWGAMQSERDRARPGSIGRGGRVPFQGCSRATQMSVQTRHRHPAPLSSSIGPDGSFEQFRESSRICGPSLLPTGGLYAPSTSAPDPDRPAELLRDPCGGTVGHKQIAFGRCGAARRVSPAAMPVSGFFQAPDNGKTGIREH